MVDKTYASLGTVTSVDDADLVAVYPTGGPLKAIAWLSFVAQLVTDLTPSFLKISNNLSDLNSAGVARGNLGLGTVSVLATGTTSGTIAVLGTGGKTPISTLPGGWLSKTSTYTVTVADAGKTIDCPSGTFTITLPSAAVAGESFSVDIRNSGSGVITVSPAAGTVDGAATATLTTGVIRTFVNDGTDYYSTHADPNQGVIQVQLQRTSGSSSGETLSSAAWGTRLLNTSVLNTIAGASLASNQITLPAGTYKVTVEAPSAPLAGATAFRGRVRLRNTTGSATLISGRNAFMAAIPGGAASTVVLGLQGIFTLTTSSAIELQSWTDIALDTYPAISTGDVEIYNDVMIEKIA